jgi:hypothetical protein
VLGKIYRYNNTMCVVNSGGRNRSSIITQCVRLNSGEGINIIYNNTMGEVE